MSQKTVLKQKKKKKNKEVVIVEQKSKSAQNVALHALQKQMQVLRLKEWLVLIGVAVGAALLRVPMQAVPSAEPLTFFAVLAGWLFGRKKGFFRRRLCLQGIQRERSGEIPPPLATQCKCG